MTPIPVMLNRLNELYDRRESLKKDWLQNEDDIVMLQELIIYQAEKEERNGIQR